MERHQTLRNHLLISVRVDAGANRRGNPAIANLFSNLVIVEPFVSNASDTIRRLIQAPLHLHSLALRIVSCGSWAQTCSVPAVRSPSGFPAPALSGLSRELQFPSAFLRQLFSAWAQLI
jgi:hypothetical protein